MRTPELCRMFPRKAVWQHMMVLGVHPSLRGACSGCGHVPQGATMPLCMPASLPRVRQVLQRRS